MRAQEWKGLITNASPYALPPGAATEQVNLRTHIPGQLISRGGMRRLQFDQAYAEVVDIYPYVQGFSRLIALKPDGTVVALTAPLLSAAPSAPFLAPLSPAVGQVQSNYMGQFYEYGGEPPA